jgi:translation initiation factor 5
MACKNPETELILTKSEDIIRDCKACGQRSGVDMRHKLTTFIVKNPPKSAKKSRATKKASGDNGDGAEGSGDRTPEHGGEDGGSDDELTRRIKAEAAELAPTSPATEDWSADTSAEAVRARVKELEGGIKSQMVLGDDDSDEGGDSPYTQLALWAEENRDKASSAEVFKKTQELGIEKKHRTVQVLVQSLFTENIVAEIPKFAPLFSKVCLAVFPL